jgi:DNA-binding CsgD family transcriptional regulator/tetratricopeptide (TPR) repeat protein
MPRSSGPTKDRQHALELASLLPDGVLPVPWLEAVGIQPETIASLIQDEIWVATENPAELRFADPAQRTALAAALAPSPRQTHHHAIANAGQKLRLPPEFIAPHCEATQRFAEARDYWLKAAEKACSRSQYEAALTWIQRALMVWPWTVQPTDRIRVLKEQARCASNGGRLDAVRSAWEELADYASDNSLPLLEVESLRQLAGCADDAFRIADFLSRAADIAERHLTAAQAFPHVMALVDHLANRARLTLAQAAMDRAFALAVSTEDPALLSEAFSWQGLLAAMTGRHQAAQQSIEEGLRIALNHDLKDQAALAYRRRANICDYQGNYPGEQSQHHEAIQYCRSNRRDGEMTCLSCLAYACFRLGDWKDALSTAKTVLADPAAHPALKAIAQAVLGMIFAFRGERAPATRHLQASLQAMRVDGMVGLEFFCLWALAYCHQIDGESSAATACYDEVRALWRETEDVHDVVPALLFGGAHYADMGLTDRLTDCVDILGSILRSNPIEEVQAAHLALRAEQAALHDASNPEISVLLDSATARLHTANLPLERLWIECRHARLSPNYPVSARSLATATRLGLRPLLASIKAPTLSAATDQPTADLTPRQIDVLRGLASGLTSKEIAARLHLSTRTVEMHVTRLLERLNCRTRTEAVRLATQRGWL